MYISIPDYTATVAMLAISGTINLVLAVIVYLLFNEKLTPSQGQEIAK